MTQIIKINTDKNNVLSSLIILISVCSRRLYQRSIH